MTDVRRRQPQTVSNDSPSMNETPDLRGDEWNIFLLLMLYLLQGIPLGLAMALPMILQNRGASFQQQAEFSFAMWPFSLKLLWAPLVDSLYIRSFGRRKTWLVPVQILIGTFLIYLSYHLESWLGDEATKEEPHVAVITLLFFILNFLVATQDIAVDGWALTMLKRNNVDYASTCNSVGQMGGYFLGYVVFIALESPSFCNSYLRSDPSSSGVVTLPGFFSFWGIVYLIVTLIIAVVKKEAYENIPRTSAMLAIKNNYKQLLQVLCLPSIRILAFILLTAKIGFAACDGVTNLKLTESGVPKEKLALLAVPLVPMQIILPVILARCSSRRQPMSLYLKVFPFRLMFNVIAAIFVYLTPLILQGKDFPLFYYLLLLVLLSLQQVTVTTMFVQSMAFYAVISDPAVGGTYMTLLNTLSNLGGTWTTTTALALVDNLTYRECSNRTILSQCSTPQQIKECTSGGGECKVTFDGYYLETGLLTLFGYLWFSWGGKVISDLQSRSRDAWRVRER